ncbi:hypothetical protein SAMN05443572_101835 [Myxococcus fulvus]|uniref:Lipoprotein n=1 Tax=Myxococcus fulvus TaxID=33 RepID=A0ABY1BXE4_MYXFU|nr:hypothetical protein SAMN05443572_101835 [Myxococcus fulvus]
MSAPMLLGLAWTALASAFIVVTLASPTCSGRAA